MLVIPLDELSPDACKGVLEEIVSRDGAELTDTADKVEQVLRQIRAGKAALVYDEESQTCNVVSTTKLRQAGLV